MIFCKAVCIVKSTIQINLTWLDWQLEMLFKSYWKVLKTDANVKLEMCSCSVVYKENHMNKFKIVICYLESDSVHWSIYSCLKQVQCACELKLMLSMLTNGFGLPSVHVFLPVARGREHSTLPPSLATTWWCTVSSNHFDIVVELQPTSLCLRFGVNGMWRLL